MKHAVVVAHPNPNSLCEAIAEAYRESVESLGQTVIVRDLYKLGFDPALKAGEIPKPSGYQFGADVVAERELLADVDVFALVYPLWFNAPPAMLKGYVDRVFSMGFGFGPGLGGSEPLLTGKSMISFTTSGAPDDWVRETGALQALMTLFDRHVSQMCGLRMVDHVHTGGIVSNITDEAVADILAKVRATVNEHFGGLDRPDEAQRGVTPGSPG
jgi:NAD(P)H dehydrogenase (quinone)